MLRGFRGSSCPVVPLSEAESDVGEIVGLTFDLGFYVLVARVCVSSVICCGASYKIDISLGTGSGLEVFLLVK